MKFFHLSDLHIGKMLNGYSLKENQEEVLRQIVDYAARYRPEAVLICGDIYDKTTPSGEAYTMFGSFLEQLSALKPQLAVLIIAGNHDSPERLAYAGPFLEKHRIHLSVFPPRTPEESIKKVVLQDEYGPVNFYLLPFLKPGYVRGVFEEEEIDGYESAIRKLLKREKIREEQRNVILSHQFYGSSGKDPETCDSETAVLFSGGLDRVDGAVLSEFDYAALGHLHGSQKVGREAVRYCGTPYKYSVSEEHQKKSITVVTMGKKGEPLQYEFLPLKGIQDVRREKGSLTEVLNRGKKGGGHDFVSVTVTEEEEPFHMREQLEEVYDHLLEFKIDNERTRNSLKEDEIVVPVQSPLEVFLQFYETVHHAAMDEESRNAIEKVILMAKEEEGT